MRPRAEGTDHALRLQHSRRRPENRQGRSDRDDRSSLHRLPGLWQHFSVPRRALDADSFADGVGFDGSSIRGFQEIQESDMLVIPDPTTAFLDPFAEAPTLVLSATFPIRSPARAIAAIRATSRRRRRPIWRARIGDTAYFGPELEHFVFNEVRYDQCANYGYYEIDAVEANWSARRRRRPGSRPHPAAEGGLFPGAAGRCAAGRAQRDGDAPRSASASRSKPTITRSPPAVRARSTCALRR